MIELQLHKQLNYNYPSISATPFGINNEKLLLDWLSSLFQKWLFRS